MIAFCLIETEYSRVDDSQNLISLEIVDEQILHILVPDQLHNLLSQFSTLAGACLAKAVKMSAKTDRIPSSSCFQPRKPKMAWRGNSACSSMYSRNPELFFSMVMAVATLRSWQISQRAWQSNTMLTTYQMIDGLYLQLRTEVLLVERFRHCLFGVLRV